MIHGNNAWPRGAQLETVQFGDLVPNNFITLRFFTSEKTTKYLTKGCKKSYQKDPLVFQASFLGSLW